MFGKNDKQLPDFEIFTIYDSKTKTYENPHFEVNEDVLRRNLLNLFNDPRQAQNKYVVNAEDYSIFRIGTYIKTTGRLATIELEHVSNMNDLRALSNWKPNWVTFQEKVQKGPQGIVST